MPSGVFYLNSLDSSIYNRRVSDCFFFYHYNHVLQKNHVLNANSVDTYQTQPSVASDLGLNSLLSSLLLDARHNLWIN